MSEALGAAYLLDLDEADARPLSRLSFLPMVVRLCFTSEDPLRTGS
jgi:hypothetical protein